MIGKFAGAGVSERGAACMRLGMPGADGVDASRDVRAVPPDESGRPVTHWTPRELADEVIKRGIVEAIPRDTWIVS